MENVVIKFDVKNEEILATIDLLEKVGQVEKGTAEEFRKSAAIRKAASDAATASQEQAIVTNQQTQKSLEGVNNSLKDIVRTVAGGAINEGLKKVGDAAEQSERKTTSLKAQLRALKNEIALLDEGTPRFTQLSIEAAKLSHQIEVVQARVHNLASETKGINALISGAQGLTGAFAAAEGASALFGDKNEEVEKTLLKVNSAMAILNGLHELQAVFLEESAAKSYLAATAQGVYAAVVGESTGALKAFRIALAGTGIGLVILGLGYLISKMQENTEKTKDQIKAEQELSQKRRDAEFDIKKEVDNLKGLQSVINDGNNSLQVKKGAYLELQKLVPTLTGLTYEQATAQGVLNQYIKDEITLIELRGKAKALEAILVEENKKAFEKEIEENKISLGAKRLLLAEDLKKQGFTDKEIQQRIKEAGLDQTEISASSKLLDIKKQIYEIESKQKSITDSQKTDKKAATNAESEREKEIKENEKENDRLTNIFQKATNNRIEVDKKAKDKQLKNQIDFNENQTKEAEKANAELDKIAEQSNLNRQKEQEDLQKAYITATHETFDSLRSINQSYLDWEISQYDDQLKKKQISQAQYDKQVKEAKRKQAQIDKELAAFSIALSTAEAIVKFLADPGGPAGVVLSISAGVKGLAELAAVNAKPIPAFKSGTKSSPPGFKWVGEAGPELIHTPGNDIIMPHQKSVDFAKMYFDDERMKSAFDFPNIILNENNHTKHEKDFDYRRLGKEVANALTKAPIPGIEVYINSDGSKEVYNSQRYG